MSHSTSINQTNVNIYVKQTNMIGAIVGMDQLAPPGTVSQAAQDFEKAVMPKFLDHWNSVHPSTNLPSGNIDFGYMGPWSELQPGQVPICVRQQINLDLGNWGLPTAAGAAKRMAQTITQAVYNHGGQAAIAAGTTQAGANQSIDWMVLSGQIYITQEELGVCYLFAAALDSPI